MVADFSQENIPSCLNGNCKAFDKPDSEDSGYSVAFYWSSRSLRSRGGDLDPTSQREELQRYCGHLQFTTIPVQKWKIAKFLRTFSSLHSEFQEIEISLKLLNSGYVSYLTNLLISY